MREEQRPEIVVTTINVSKDKSKPARHQDKHLRIVAQALRADAQNQPPPQARTSRQMAHDLVRPPAATALEVRSAAYRKLKAECLKRKAHEEALTACVAERDAKIAALEARVAELEAGVAHG